MQKNVKNLVVILGIITVVFGIYYLLTQDSGMFIQSSQSQQQLDNLVASSQLFLDRSQALQQVDIDTTIFQSEVLNSLRTFSGPPSEYATGRDNPFLAPVVTQ